MSDRKEGRTQLVGYAYAHGLAKSTTEARKMDLEHLRRVVELHRKAVAAQNKRDGIDDASIATWTNTGDNRREGEGT